MSLKGKDVAEQIWNFCMSHINNPYGVAGLMGNIKAESNLVSNNLQNSYEKKLGMSDEQYTKAVDSGRYTNFVHDSAGYGLVQWTYWTLKRDLLEYVQSQKKSVGDLETQLEFLMKQLRRDYVSVWNILLKADSVLEASNAVLLRFERPANQSVNVQRLRAKYGQTFYDTYALKKEVDIMYSRQKAVDLINSWVGRKESDGTHRYIIDLYNNLIKPLPRNYRVKYTDAWCATTVSAVATQLGYTDIIPTECSVYYLIEKAKKMGIWVENDSYVPKCGDLVCYDWQDNGAGDNTGSPDHVGMVTYVNAGSGYFVVTEGNYSDSVKKRTISINGRFIRGFICPKYTDDKVEEPPKNVGGKSVDTIAHEVIAGQWGSGDARKNNLTNAGYDYAAVQERVNEILNGGAVQPKPETPQDQSQPSEKKVTATAYAAKHDGSLTGTYRTTANLNMRNDAGTNKKSLVVIPKGTVVSMYGYYSVYNGAKWYYVVTTIGGVIYTGFCHSAYLKKC